MSKAMSAKDGMALVTAMQSTIIPDMMDINRKCIQYMQVVKSGKFAEVEMINLISKNKDAIQACVNNALEFLIFCRRGGVQFEKFDIKRKE